MTTVGVVEEEEAPAPSVNKRIDGNLIAHKGRVSFAIPITRAPSLGLF